jgi:hypothetical protein
MGAAEFGIVIVMMVVRAAPDTAGTQDENSEDPHENSDQPGMRQNGPVLLIVVDDEEPEIKESGQNAARDFCRDVSVPDHARKGGCQQDGGGNNVPPAFGREIRGVRPCCK